MYARGVSIHLRQKTGRQFAEALERDVLPMLRQQNGFKDEISFVSTDRDEALAISFWERQEDADAYHRNVYPSMLKSLAHVVAGTPRVEAYEVSTSTFHRIASEN